MREVAGGQQQQQGGQCHQPCPQPLHATLHWSILVSTENAEGPNTLVKVDDREERQTSGGGIWAG